MSYFKPRLKRALDYVATRVADRISSDLRLTSRGTETGSKVATPLAISPDTTHFYIHTRDGHRFFLDAKDLHISLHVLEHGCWEDHIRSALQLILKPGDTFVDVGANVGLHSLFAGSIVGSEGEVHSFEPLPHLFNTLKLNIDVNGFGNVIKPYQLAVAEAEEARAFSNFHSHAAMSGFTVPEVRLDKFGETAAESVDVIKVQTTTIDSLFSDKRVDGIKVDVEGYESLVLQGAGRVIRQNPNIKLILEWDPPLVINTLGERSLVETIQFLDAEGFQPYLALWQQPMKRIGWNEAPHVGGDLVLSRTPL